MDREGSHSQDIERKGPVFRTENEGFQTGKFFLVSSLKKISKISFSACLLAKRDEKK
jgi:hypothetical protein